MQESGSFLKKLFLPFVCLLALMGTAAMFCQQIAALVPAPIPSMGVFRAMELGTLAVLAGIVFLMRKGSFERIFKTVLGGAAVLMVGATYFFPQTLGSYFLLHTICPKLLLFLGWAYLNQIAHREEGKTYYFGMVLVAGIIASPLAILLPTLQGPLAPVNMLVVSTLICLALAFLCKLWAHRAEARAIHWEGSFGKWESAVYLTVVFAALYPAAAFLDQMFKAKLNGMAAFDFQTFMGRHSVIVGAGTTILALLAAFLGPRVVRAIGWKRSVLIAPIVGAAAALLFLLTSMPYFYTIGVLDLRGLQHVWILPLTFIALLGFGQRERFFTQAWISLVGIPIVEWGARALHFGLVGAAIAEFVVLGAMILCAHLFAKKHAHQ